MDKGRPLPGLIRGAVLSHPSLKKSANHPAQRPWGCGVSPTVLA